MTENKKPLLLIIDDETAILNTLKQALEDEDFVVETLADGKQALAHIGRLVPDLVLLDIFMPQCNGVDLLVRIKKEYPAQKVIMISGFGTISIAIDAIKKGASDFIEKPLNLDEILTKIAFLKNPIAITAAQPKNTPPPYQSCGIIGASALFCELMHHASLIAPLNLPIIIYGPPGSGKTLLVNYIHTLSTQNTCDFTIINCSAATTFDATVEETCGTIFLKNIHSLSPQAQQELLSILSQEKPCQRFIASSIPTLFRETQDGTFNRSLFCKFHVTPLEIPAIIKRRYDIPLLVDHFLNQANIAYKKSISLTPAALRFLRNYQWIGDVAHIKKIVETIVYTALHNTTVIDHIDVQKLLPIPPTRCMEEQQYSRFHSFTCATEMFQRQYLVHLLKLHRYNTVQLAEFLEMPLTQLHDKMAELHINQ